MKQMTLRTLSFLHPIKVCVATPGACEAIYHYNRRISHSPDPTAPTSYFRYTKIIHSTSLVAVPSYENFARHFKISTSGSPFATKFTPKTYGMGRANSEVPLLHKMETHAALSLSPLPSAIPSPLSASPSRHYFLTQRIRPCDFSTSTTAS